MLRFILLIKDYNEYSTLDILYIFEYYMHSVHHLHRYIYVKIYSLIINHLLYILYILSRVMSIPCIFYTLKFPVKMPPNIQFSRESSPSSLTSSDPSQSWSAVSRLISVRTRKAAKWKKGLAYSLFFPSAGPVLSICGYLATYRVSLCMYVSCMLQRCRISRFRTCKETSSASFPRFPCPIVYSVHVIVG